ncbi:hypothetical protein JYU34_000847 [Plutella xylostella]|uniref:Uncharacterized protein n=1 Tax=Plutella xylostella TaxID=51655 RepID=A0ABQ7R5G9_PLUXY|nr:hypothetical protein JYU34_000847 [Plutella xylostella]
MSGSSSRGADIIDLDRYMRGVAPADTARNRGALIVDAGGRRARGACERDGSTCYSLARSKALSHDSGVSDASYRRRGRRYSKPRKARRPRDSSEDSQLSFRAHTERALRLQQQQLSQVAALCSRLAASPRIAPPPPQPPPPEPPEAPVPTRRRRSRCSELSTTTPDSAPEDGKIDECKTYKIIMTKLDQLNHLFLARAEATAGAGRARRVPRGSGGTVCVSDKLVATDPAGPGGCQLTPTKNHRRSSRQAFATGLPKGDLDYPPTRVVECGAGSRVGCGAGYSPREVHARVTSTRRDSPSLRRRDRDSTSIPSSDEYVNQTGCKYDLEDPMHLYVQAKRLQPPRAPASPAPPAAPATLCARCYGYWCSLRRCLHQLCPIR